MMMMIMMTMKTHDTRRLGRPLPVTLRRQRDVRTVVSDGVNISGRFSALSHVVVTSAVTSCISSHIVVVTSGGFCPACPAMFPSYMRPLARLYDRCFFFSRRASETFSLLCERSVRNLEFLRTLFGPGASAGRRSLRRYVIVNCSNPRTWIYIAASDVLSTVVSAGRRDARCEVVGPHALLLAECCSFHDARAVSCLADVTAVQAGSGFLR